MDVTLTRTTYPKIVADHVMAMVFSDESDIFQLDNAPATPQKLYRNGNLTSRAGTRHRFWIDFGSILRFSECIAIPLESILSQEFNSIWRSNLVFICTLKCSWRRAVISPLLRMLLWCEINVNTAHCELSCKSLQPFPNLWMIILGSSMCKDLETSRVRLFLKHAAPSAVQN